MKRTKLKEPKNPLLFAQKVLKEHGRADAIFGADWHLMAKAPLCRTDDFHKAMWTKLDFISWLQSEHDCPIYHAGDLFDYWDAPYWLFSLVAKKLKRFFSTYGNHDLPQHSYDERMRCGLYALSEASPDVNALDFGYWNYEPQDGDGIVIKGKRILVWHKCVFQIKEPWMDSIDSYHALRVLKQNPQYDIIVTGDNHKAFIEEHEGRLLLNCGSLMRTRAGQIDYQPHIHLWYADNNKIISIPLPIQKGVVSREHLDKKTARDERIDTFVKSFNEWESGLDFEENLKLFERKQKPAASIMQIVYKSIDYATV